MFESNWAYVTIMFFMPHAFNKSEHPFGQCGHFNQVELFEKPWFFVVINKGCLNLKVPNKSLKGLGQGLINKKFYNDFLASFVFHSLLRWLTNLYQHFKPP
jgi:hypothetical protein